LTCVKPVTKLNEFLVLPHTAPLTVYKNVFTVYFMCTMLTFFSHRQHFIEICANVMLDNGPHFYCEAGLFDRGNIAANNFSANFYKMC